MKNVALHWKETTIDASMEAMHETSASINPVLAAPPDGREASTIGARQSRGEMWGVLALTLFSGLLCFNRLSHPSMLIDECFTYWRICGTQGELLDTLRNDAFVPLHYELLNWIRQGFPLGFGVHIVPGGVLMTPAAMRFVPALSMTLMTPVMYFLARQMFNRRTATIAGIFIACSAYGLFFSHYAKMYATAWMLETLTIACFIWWIRTWERLAWLCWIAAGIAASGFHAVTMLLLPLAPLYFISMGKFKGLRVPMLTAGLALIIIGPAIYYASFNKWTQNSGGIVPGVVGKTAPDADWRASGLEWLTSIDNSFEAPIEALNNYLSGFDWKTLDDLEHPSEFVEKFSVAMIALAVATYGVFIFGALPWPTLRKDRKKAPTAQPWWRSLLWLMLWLVMPVYGFFYCRSVEDFSSPLVWVRSAWDFLRPVWGEALGGAVVVTAVCAALPRVAKYLAIPLVLGAAVVAGFSAANKFQWMNYALRPWVLMSDLALAGGMIFYYSGATMRERFLQLGRLVAVVGLVIGLCDAMYWLWTWMHEVSLRRHPDLAWQPMWHVRYVAIVWPAVWLAAAALVGRLPTKGVRIAVVLMICSYNLANGLARQYGSTEVPLDRVAADIYSSQPDSSTRTYFELHDIFDSTYYKPLAIYNACIAARMWPSPTDFRVGNSWPFEYGPAASQFRGRCIYNNTITPGKIGEDTARDSKISRVILWECSRNGIWNENGADAVNPANAGLSGKWQIASNEEIISRWDWDWTTRWWFRRREFRRVG